MKVLVVDDSALARMSLMRHFPEKVDEVFQAANGQEACDLYKKHSPDLVFMDLTMPVMDGYGASEEILSYDKDAKIIVVSADSQPKAIERVKQIGVLMHIKKNIDKDAIDTIFNTYV